ncbi:MAG: dihydropteroate synthase [Mariprofundaceae bacterium]|nr:dihydropteroate synthase [Mariprofundaceae bacterium]
MLATPWLHSDKPLLMGVLNCTPDSFSDGGKYLDTNKAITHGQDMARQGASIIDVGGESTRPSSHGVSVQQELDRVIPVIQQLSDDGLYVSIDSSKPEVMRQACIAGARMINDVNALCADGAIQVAVEANVDVCLMHKQGVPQSMQDQPCYEHALDDIKTYLQQRMQCCLTAGMQAEKISIDPGIGFGKRLNDNLLLQAHLAEFKEIAPVLLGISRKSFLAEISGSQLIEREIETAAALSIAVWQGVDMLRVHDIATQKRALEVAYQLRVARAY